MSNNPNQQIQVLSNPADLHNYLNKAKKTLEAALPKHLNPERMMRLALTAFSTTPKLRQCTAQSILGSLIVASQLGLEPGIAGQGYLIPYKTTCTFVPGWQGLVGLLNNTGRATAWTRAVFEGDQFYVNLGNGHAPDHIPGPNFGDDQQMTGVYAVGKVNGSESYIVEYWPIARVWRHRDRFNKVGNDHYSFRHPEMYARKVVLLQVLKYLPRSIELNNAITAADAADAGRTSQVIEGGVVIDVDESGAMQEGNVGGNASLTEMRQAEGGAGAGGGDAGGSGSGTQTPEDPAAPTAEQLLADIMGRAGKVDAGKVKLKGVLVSMKLMEPAEALEKLSVKKLASILDSWTEIADEITHPGSSR